LSTILINSYSFSNGILSQPTILTLTMTPTYTGSDLNQIQIVFPS